MGSRRKSVHKLWLEQFAGRSWGSPWRAAAGRRRRARAKQNRAAIKLEPLCGLRSDIARGAVDSPFVTQNQFGRRKIHSRLKITPTKKARSHATWPLGKTIRRKRAQTPDLFPPFRSRSRNDCLLMLRTSP